MTTPPSRPDPVPAIVWTHADDVLRAEEAAARTVAGPLRNQLDELLKSFQLRWVREFGSLRGQADGPAFLRLMADLSTALRRLRVGGGAAQALQAAATDAAALGRRQAYVEAGLDPIELAVEVLDAATVDYAYGVAESAQALLTRSSALARTVTRGSFTVVARTVSVAQQGANQLDRAARTLTNAHVNAGIGRVADELGARQLWVAERDACVHCLALSGHLPDERTGLFDASRTFGGRPLTWEPEGGLTGPPRHPNCRCRITPWFGHDRAGALSITHDWAGAIAEARANGDQVGVDAAHRAAAAARASSAVDLPEALRREAERSVLNGWALPSEPTSVRAQAAERLLNRITDGRAPSGWQVPASVRKGAQRDITKGTFRKRAFPGP